MHEQNLRSHRSDEIEIGRQRVEAISRTWNGEFGGVLLDLDVVEFGRSR